MVNIWIKASVTYTGKDNPRAYKRVFELFVSPLIEYKLITNQFIATDGEKSIKIHLFS